MKIFRILLLSLGCTLLNTQAFANEGRPPIRLLRRPAGIRLSRSGSGHHHQLPWRRQTLGYVRVTVELMATDAADLKLLEQHDPLIRDAIIRLIGSKTGAQIKSLVNREELRKECEAKVNELLVKGDGQEGGPRAHLHQIPVPVTTPGGSCPLTRCIHCRGRRQVTRRCVSGAVTRSPPISRRCARLCANPNSCVANCARSANDKGLPVPAAAAEAWKVGPSSHEEVHARFQKREEG